MLGIRIYRDAGLQGSRWDVFIHIPRFRFHAGIQFRPFLVYKEVYGVIVSPATPLKQGFAGGLSP